MDVDREPEISREIAAHFAPGFSGIIAPHNVPMLLHEENIWPLRMHRDVVDAVADLGIGIGNVLRMQPTVDGLPALPAIVSPERSGGRDRDINTLWILGIDQD